MAYYQVELVDEYGTVHYTDIQGENKSDAIKKIESSKKTLNFISNIEQLKVLR